MPTNTDAEVPRPKPRSTTDLGQNHAISEPKGTHIVNLLSPCCTSDTKSTDQNKN